MKLIFTWDVTVSVQGNVDHSLGVQVKTPSSSKSTITNWGEIEIAIYFFTASEDTVETLSRVPQLLDNMILAYGHQKGFLQLLSLFEPSETE